MLGVVGNRHPLTVRLYEYIERESFNIFRTFSNIADETGVHELAVRDIFTARAAQLDKIKLIETPRWIAIDEVYPKKKNEPRCVVSAPEFRRVLDLLPDNKRVTITKWLLNLPDRHSVAVVTMDMWDPYRSVVRRLLPGAAIVVDRYHVHNLLSVALKQVIKVVRDSMTYTERRTYMRREELLLKNYRRLSKERGKGKNGKERPSEKELVEQWLEEVPDIKTAHSLAKEFSDILQLSDRQKAEELTDLWLERVCKFVEDFRAKYRGNYREDDWPDPFGNVPNTITHWRENILNYINYKGRFGINVTNGFAEFANKQIKKAQKLGNYSFEALRHKVVHGGVLVKRRPPHPLDEKRSRRKRRQATDDNVGRREKNPQANVVRLQRARRERDETEGLLPKPQDSLGWATRFESADQLKSDCATNEQGFDKTQHGADRRPRSSVRIDPEQGTLF
jgi:transposase